LVWSLKHQISGLRARESHPLGRQGGECVGGRGEGRRGRRPTGLGPLGRRPAAPPVGPTVAGARLLLVGHPGCMAIVPSPPTLQSRSRSRGRPVGPQGKPLTLTKSVKATRVPETLTMRNRATQGCSSQKHGCDVSLDLIYFLHLLVVGSWSNCFPFPDRSFLFVK
jgi:hypothetical protein